MTDIKWYNTTAGRVGIGLGVAGAVVGIVLLVKHFMEPKVIDITHLQDKKEPDKNPTHTDSLPTGKCADVKTGFDKSYNYVKCDGIWWTISKDRSKIPDWKSLADNKAATELLNNKYP